MKTLGLAIATLCLALPATAGAQLPEDVSRVHGAVVELSKAKRSLRAKAEGAQRAADASLAPCRSRGRGWRRIRAVRDASQRNAYTRGASSLWADLQEAAVLQAAVHVYEPAWERYLARLDAPFVDPVVQSGADAVRGRLGYVRSAYAFASCRTFERQLRKVREFKIGGEHGVAGDYRVGRIHNEFVGYVASRQRHADAKHGGSGAEARLEAARTRIVALGGDFGYASYFIAAHSLNN